jgi:hypothetical protein
MASSKSNGTGQVIMVLSNRVTVINLYKLYNYILLNQITVINYGFIKSSYTLFNMAL